MLAEIRRSLAPASFPDWFFERYSKMFAQQFGQFFKTEKRRQEVKVGAIFRNVRRGNIIETAKVLDIAPDSMGVPHVHFALSVQSTHQEGVEEHRTLGLATFAEKFSGAVTA